MRKKLFKRRGAILALTFVLCMVFSSVAFAVPVGAPTVTVTQATSLGGTLSWTAVTDATGYKVYVDGVLAKDAGNVLSTTVSGLDIETSYSVTVKAYDAGGEGPASEAVTLLTTGASLEFNFDSAQMFQWTQSILNAMMPVLYISLGIGLAFIVIRALKGAFN